MTASTKPTPSPSKNPKKVFVVSPIGAPGTEVHRKASYALKYIFREALKGDEWDVHRADEGKSPDSIGQHVIKRIYEADLVIADLTGHNPNVFYELAIAHGWRKPVVHLISKGEKVPFDIVDQRTIFYDITDLGSVEEAVVTLRDYAQYALEHVAELVNPLTSFEMFNQIRADQAEGGDAVADALEQVVARLSRIEGRIGSGLGTPRDEEYLFRSNPELVEGVATRLVALGRVLREMEDGSGTQRQRMRVRREMEDVMDRIPPSLRGPVTELVDRKLASPQSEDDSA